jgi:hypothetical protein
MHQLEEMQLFLPLIHQGFVVQVMMHCRCQFTCVIEVGSETLCKLLVVSFWLGQKKLPVRLCELYCSVAIILAGAKVVASVVII